MAWRLVEGTDWDGKMETFEDIEEYCDLVKETHPEMECIDLYSTAPEIFFMYMEIRDWLPSMVSVICGMIRQQRIQPL